METKETKETLETFWTDALWQQFGAAMKMLDNALQACPDSLWRERLWSAPPDDPQSPRGEVWRTAYHTLYWLDLYLSSIADAPVSLPHRLFLRPHSTQRMTSPNGPTRKRRYAPISPIPRRSANASLRRSAANERAPRMSSLGKRNRDDRSAMGN